MNRKMLYFWIQAALYDIDLQSHFTFGYILDLNHLDILIDAESFETGSCWLGLLAEVF